MTHHFTVRMAWHDNGWDGNICREPRNNYYCVGARSLLSERIARKRNVELEVTEAGQKLSALVPGYLPPCYWTSSAFSPKKQTIIHDHPFRKYEEAKKIEEPLGPYSVFSWPFRLSFNHSQGKRNAQGSYPRDLNQRISHFVNKFEPNESVVFFYLNYDNPVSGDDERYALVGCAVINNIPSIPPNYDFSDDELRTEQKKPGMKYFPLMNWALQVSYDFENTGIRLPYQEYLDYIKEHPEESEKLEEIKVLVEEKSLVFGFKYVMADIDEDQCILLLTKLRKAIDIVQDHGIMDFNREQRLVNQLLEKAWNRRGLYPGLPAVLDVILEEDSMKGAEIVETVQQHLAHDEDLCDKTLSLVLDRKQGIPGYLREFGTDIYTLRKNVAQHTTIIGLFKKLSLFLLTRKQIRNIILQDDGSFVREIGPKEIAANPYVLCEEYKYRPTDQDLDSEEIEDAPIDLFKIDVGMFPEKYVKGNTDLQNMAPAGPERLRAVVIDYLYSIGANEGHCYSVLEDLYDYIMDYPLFYKRELTLNKRQLLSEAYLDHFTAKLVIIDNEGRQYFYLKEAAEAEEIIRGVVKTLLTRENHNAEISDLDAFIKKQAEELCERHIQSFDEKQFIEERTKLLKNVLKKSFYVISGKPGTGKTKVIEKIINELEGRGEEVIVLAPTGKASIRLKLDCGARNAQTIDRFIYTDERRYWEILQDFSLLLQKDRENLPVDNLIVDESSMVDLQKLTALFSMLQLEGEQKVKRVIMVGDENQLPPIGFGRPFYDIIQYVVSDPQRKGQNYCRLLTNCRQESDTRIIEFADVFSGKNRYYDELLDELLKKRGGMSKGLAIERWTSSDQLHHKIEARLETLFSAEIDKTALAACKNKSEMFNLLLGLYPNGFVKKANTQELGIDNFQLLSPYRTEASGSIGLSRFIKSNYPRSHWADAIFKSPFTHAEKIIRLSNEYIYDTKLKKRVLRLSNGSIGIINNKQSDYRMYYFTDQENAIFNLNEEDDFELAYAITVHKSQGSDFGNVFFIVPSKRSLLCKELLYTALTRSKRSLTVFLHQEEGKELLEYARNQSAILKRNTSLFEAPQNSRELFEPTKGIGVKSKIEYILYKTLETSGLDFTYETPLHLAKGPEKIKPDFTITVDGKAYYWEHLGELDLREYWTRWVTRREWYKTNSKFEQLITSDDLGGVKQERILKVIADIKEGKPTMTPDSRFSGHHYQLYD